MTGGRATGAAPGTPGGRAAAAPGTGPFGRLDPTVQPQPSAGDTVVVANEFAEVTVRRVGTGNGVRLEICSPRLGRSIALDPLQLECLTWQEPAVFSDLLRDPFGPPAGTS